MPLYQIVVENIRTSDKTNIFKKIQKYTPRCGFQNCWIIQTSQSAVQVRDYLMATIHDDECRLLVTSLSREAAWHVGSKKFSNIFKNMLNN